MEVFDTAHVPKGNDIAYLSRMTEYILSDGSYSKEVEHIRFLKTEKEKEQPLSKKEKTRQYQHEYYMRVTKKKRKAKKLERRRI